MVACVHCLHVVLHVLHSAFSHVVCLCVGDAAFGQFACLHFAVCMHIRTGNGYLRCCRMLYSVSATPIENADPQTERRPERSCAPRKRGQTRTQPRTRNAHGTRTRAQLSRRGCQNSCSAQTRPTGPRYGRFLQQDTAPFFKPEPAAIRTRTADPSESRDLGTSKFRHLLE